MNMANGLGIFQGIFYLAKKLNAVPAKGIGFKVPGIDIIFAIKGIDYSCVIESLFSIIQCL
jgi:hypothetical protein